MKKADLIKEMRDSIGTKDPIVYFDKMVDVFELLFSEFEKLENNLHKIQNNTALSIQWEPKVAADLIAKQIDLLRDDKETYFEELSLLKKAYQEDLVTQDYKTFVEFWMDTLGWHPFLDYKD